MATGPQSGKDFGSTVGGAADQARDTASHLADQARQGAAHLADQARQGVANLADQARQGASHLADQARQAGSSAASGADDVAGRVGSGLSSAAGALREHAPNSGVLGSAASRVADGLESGGRYLEEEGLTGMAGDLTDLVKRNPIPALLVAVAVGVLIARSTRS